MEINYFDITKFLDQQEITYKPTPDERQLIINCPVCGKADKVYINTVAYTDDQSKEHPIGMWDCKSASCQEKGNWWQFRKQFTQPDKKKVNMVTDKLVQYYVSRLPSHPKLIEYLHGRGFSDKTIAYFNLGVDDLGRITAPVKCNGKFVGVQKKNMNYEAEMLEYQQKKDLNQKCTKPAPWTWIGEPGVFNSEVIDEVLVTEPSELLLHEGLWDTMASYEYGMKYVIGVPGASNRKSSWIDQIKKVSKFYICYDNDIGGQKGATELASRLTTGKCRNVVLPFNDMNKCLQEQVPLKDITDIIDNAVQFEVSGMYHTSHFNAQISEEYFNLGTVKGLATGHKKFDELTRGLKGGQLVVISGLTSTGKTSFVMNSALRYAQAGAPVGIFCLESRTPKVQLDLLIQANKGVPQIQTPEDLQNELEKKLFPLPMYWFSDRDLDRGLHKELALEKIKQLRDRYGVKVIIIDNMEFLAAADRSHKNLAEKFWLLVNDLKTAAKSLDVCIIAVAALNREGSKQFGYSDDKQQVPFRVRTRPSMTQLKNSSAIEQYANFIVFVHRDVRPDASDQDKALVELVIAKNRYNGKTGVVECLYDTATCDYKEL